MTMGGRTVRSLQLLSVTLSFSRESALTLALRRDTRAVSLRKLGLRQFCHRSSRIHISFGRGVGWNRKSEIHHEWHREETSCVWR